MMAAVEMRHDPNATVQGLDAVPPDERPPVNVVRLAFQTMVGSGTLLALLGVAYLAARVRWKRLPEGPWFYRALVAAGPLSLVALIAGWVTTEVGRQPWVVYRVMRTSQAVTGAGGIPVGFGELALVYSASRSRWPGSSCGWHGRRSRRPEMHLYDVPLILALIGLAFYTVLGGADFGAGFWQLTAGKGPRAASIRDHAHHAMAPVWEANHVWLVFVLTVVWTVWGAHIRAAGG
jgi:hypothetical protein